MLRAKKRIRENSATEKYSASRANSAHKRLQPMELHFRQNSNFVFDTRLAVFYATLHNATSNCVDFVVKLFDCTWYFLFFTFNITNLACQIDDFLLLL